MAPAPAATVTAAADAAPAPKGKKKLIIIIAAAVLVLGLGGGAALLLLKKKPVDGDAETTTTEEAAPDKSAKAAKHDPGAVPVFVPLEPFTVNLADREAERFAQIGITLEIDNGKTGDQIKLYMPAIRNNILMAIADRTAAELQGREGKGELAQRIRRETARALGFEVEEEEAEAEGEAAAPRKKSKKKAAAVLPVKAVHFSNFIIQ